MSNSFDISDKPEIAANLVQILSNASALGTIQITTLPDIATQNTNIKTAVDAIADPQLPEILTAIGSNATSIGNNLTAISAIQPEQFFSVSESDTELAAADTERSDASGDYVKLKEIFASVTGKYRITFDLKSDVNTELVRATIYKNGVAFGTEQDNNTTTWVNKSEDLVFSSGDLIQLYAKAGDITMIAYVRNFKIKGTVNVLKAIVSID